MPVAARTEEDVHGTKVAQPLERGLEPQRGRRAEPRPRAALAGDTPYPMAAGWPLAGG